MQRKLPQGPKIGPIGQRVEPRIAGSDAFHSATEGSVRARASSLIETCNPVIGVTLPHGDARWQVDLGGGTSHRGPVWPATLREGAGAPGHASLIAQVGGSRPAPCNFFRR